MILVTEQSIRGASAIMVTCPVCREEQYPAFSMICDVCYSPLFDPVDLLNSKDARFNHHSNKDPWGRTCR